MNCDRVLGSAQASSRRSTASSSQGVGRAGARRTRPSVAAQARGEPRGRASSVLRARPGAGRLSGRHAWSRSASSVPERDPDASASTARRDILRATRGCTDFRQLPGRRCAAKPGEKQPNRAALGHVGRVGQRLRARRSTAGRSSSRCSADLAESTNIAGFAKDFGRLAGLGLVRARHEPARARCCPQEITEFTNAGIIGRHRHGQPRRRPVRASSTASGAPARPTAPSRYLKYGPMRLFSQLAQDCELKVGKVIWVAGHSGPGDGRGLAHALRHLRAGRDPALPRGPRDRPAPVGVQRGAGRARRRRCAAGAPIVALHLTRPAIEIPDRAALGHGRRTSRPRAGAYVIRDYRPGQPRGGTVVRPGHVDHRQPRQDPARARRARAEREDRRRASARSSSALQDAGLPRRGRAPTADRLDAMASPTARAG